MTKGDFLDLEQWPRRAQYRFFRDYELPFFNVCAEVRVTKTLAWCRGQTQSFSLACWYLCQRAVNAIASFRYRLRGDGVWIHDRIRISTIALNADETFRFCHLPYAEPFAVFVAEAEAVMARPPPEAMDDRPEDDAVIHGSTLPWVRFTSIAHARRLSPEDSVPKIVFGRYAEDRGEVTMPVSVEAHHALMDGLHVSRFFEHLERDMARPEEVLAGHQPER